MLKRTLKVLFRFSSELLHVGRGGGGHSQGASCDHVLASLVYGFVLRDDSTMKSPHTPPYTCIPV